MRLRFWRSAHALVGVSVAAAMGAVGIAVGPSTGSVQARSARHEEAPTVGALFTVTPSGQLGTHFCTASVVDSPGGDLIVTAAHCMNGRTTREVAFVPGYSRGLEPFGVWTVSR